MKSTLVNFLAKSKTHFIVQSLIANRQSKRNLVCNYSDNYYGDQICRSRVSGKSVNSLVALLQPGFHSVVIKPAVQQASIAESVLPLSPLLRPLL